MHTWISALRIKAPCTQACLALKHKQYGLALDSSAYQRSDVRIDWCLAYIFVFTSEMGRASVM